MEATKKLGSGKLYLTNNKVKCVVAFPTRKRRLRKSHLNFAHVSEENEVREHYPITKWEKSRTYFFPTSAVNTDNDLAGLETERVGKQL